MAQPLLSIGMIVKNEERCLEKCLKALEPLRQAIPCELVIADTGSTDKTKEIASHYADILFDFKWVNDFSAARNAVMDKCSGKWYLTVDADEYLLPDVTEIASFLKGSLASKKSLATIVQRNYNDTEMKGAFSDFNALRMARMDTGIRYTGTIHEAFTVTDISQIQVLSSTIFDHDGYTAVTPEHLKIKEKRNLELLEERLEKNPDDLKCLLQCLESSAHNPEKKRYYTESGFEKLRQNISKDQIFSEFVGPPFIRTIINYAISDKSPRVEEYVKFAFNTFPKSFHILIDVNYLYAGYLYQKEDFVGSLKHCKAYFDNLKTYTTTKRQVSAAEFTTPVTSLHANHKAQVQSILISAMIELDRFSEAQKYLSKMDLTETPADTLNNWIVAIANKKSTSEIISTGGKMIGNLFEQHYNQKLKSNEQYDSLIAAISNIFSCNEQTKFNFNNFKEVPGAIGLSVKIANAKTKEEAEGYLNKIEHWEEFMPLALKQALLLKVDLPKEFYLMPSARLSLLINNLSKVAGEIAEALSEKYCTLEYCNDFPRTSFNFNLLLTILFNNEISLSNELKIKLTNKFIVIADSYLNSCYNPELLKNEEYVACIPALHLFAWYLVKATKEKEQNPLEYIKTLRVALKKIPQAKDVIEFLIEEFRKEEESKKQEQLKNASPELVALAEQLKVMLSALPPNSPELLAIKQSPMYKQVAFLIEN